MTTLPADLEALMPEPAGFRSRYRSEPEMIGHYPWTWAGEERRRRKYERPECEYEDLFTADQMREAILAATERAAKAASIKIEWEHDFVRVPRHFIADVHTAAGLLHHGKRDKGVAERLSNGVMAAYAKPRAAIRTKIGGAMTDRELLEAAARAAGLRSNGDWGLLGHFGGLRIREDDNPGGYRWNPLIDDGDALRLVVTLKIPLQFPDWQDIARTWGPKNDGEGFVEPALHHNGDLGVAVRRAIVRAAASSTSTEEGRAET